MKSLVLFFFALVAGACGIGDPRAGAGSAANADSLPSRVDGMRLVPGGTFLMGTDSTEIPRIQQLTGMEHRDLFLPELPRHDVTLEPFYLDSTDVTNGAFAEFVDRNPDWGREAVDLADHNGRYLEHWTDTGPPQALLAHPVTFVTWYAAASYCRWHGKRLPTEAEWEFASRAGVDAASFPWGDAPPDSTLVNWSGSGVGGTVPVASYPANPFGLYDMSGNVWKFLADPWRPSYEGTPAHPAPVDSALAARDRRRRVVRGGSWGASIANLRVRYRDSHRPWDAREMVGFRCARSAT